MIPPEINITSAEIRQFREKLIRWGVKNYANFPWRSADNKWHALSAEVMLQRTKAEQVLPVYVRFTSEFTTAPDFLKSDFKVFESLGLKWRDREFRKLAEIISISPIPEAKEELLKLPGVGSYISAAYRSLHISMRDVIIDSNVVRIYGRYFGFATNGETRREKWLFNLADRLTPRNRYKNYNYALIDFTRAVCKPKPECKKCILKNTCMHTRDK